MSGIKTGDYPVLMAAVQRYVSSAESPDTGVICAILGIETEKKAEFVELSVISNLGFKPHVQHFVRMEKV